MRQLLAGLGIVLMSFLVGVTASGAAPLPASRDQVSVVLYGDSLAWEAQDHFRQALAAAGVADVRTETMGGTAICDWLDKMRGDALQLRPTAVVVEFSGNALTPCMSDAAGVSLALSPDDYRRRYAEDAQAVLDIFGAAGTRVYFASAPKSRQAEEARDPEAGWLNALYETLSRGRTDTRYVDAGAKVLRRGHWTETLPCLAGEPCTGGIDASGRPVNVVRAPDGGHFCPGAPDADRGVTGECPVWSSGAHRFGVAMATAVVKDLPA
jgi:hypothetical protein